MLLNAVTILKSRFKSAVRMYKPFKIWTIMSHITFQLDSTRYTFGSICVVSGNSKLNHIAGRNLGCFLRNMLTCFCEPDLHSCLTSSYSYAEATYSSNSFNLQEPHSFKNHNTTIDIFTAV